MAYLRMVAAQRGGQLDTGQVNPQTGFQWQQQAQVSPGGNITGPAPDAPPGVSGKAGGAAVEPQMVSGPVQQPSEKNTTARRALSDRKGTVRKRAGRYLKGSPLGAKKS